MIYTRFIYNGGMIILKYYKSVQSSCGDYLDKTVNCPYTMIEKWIIAMKIIKSWTLFKATKKEKTIFVNEKNEYINKRLQPTYKLYHIIYL